MTKEQEQEKTGVIATIEKKPVSFEDLKKAIGEADITLNNNASDKLTRDKNFTFEYNSKNLGCLSVRKLRGYSVNFDKRTLTIKFRREYINKKIRQYENISSKIWADILVYVENNNKSPAWAFVVSQFEQEYKNTFLWDKE